MAAVPASAAEQNQGAPATQAASASHYDVGVAAYNAGKFAEAAKDWRQAATDGDPRAQFGMGQLYELGRGVIQNRIQAHAWYNIAASQGLEVAAEARDRLAKAMNTDELAGAQKQAEAFQTGAAPAQSSAAPVAAASPATPQELFKAAEAGDVAKIKTILASGTDVNSIDADGWTALMFATAKSQKDAVQALVAAKANINIRGKKNGETPLMIAALVGSPEITKLLVDAKADQSARDLKGRTARDIAELKGEKQVMALLKVRGVDQQKVSIGPVTPRASSVAARQPQSDYGWLAGNWRLSTMPHACEINIYQVWAVEGGMLKGHAHLGTQLSPDTAYMTVRIRDGSPVNQVITEMEKSGYSIFAPAGAGSLMQHEYDPNGVFQKDVLWQRCS